MSRPQATITSPWLLAIVAVIWTAVVLICLWWVVNWLVDRILNRWWAHHYAGRCPRCLAAPLEPHRAGCPGAGHPIE